MYIRGEWALRRVWAQKPFLGAIRTAKLGDWMYIPYGADFWPLRSFSKVALNQVFWGTGWGATGWRAKGDFRRGSFSKGAPHHFPESTCTQVWAQKVWEWFHALFLPIPVHFRIENPYLFRKHGRGALSYTHSKVGNDGCIFAENGSLPAGVLRVISDGFLAPIRSCTQVWAQKVWEWLDVYSRRMGP